MHLGAMYGRNTLFMPTHLKKSHQLVLKYYVWKSANLKEKLK